MFHKPPTNCSQGSKSGRNSPNPATTSFSIVGIFFSYKYQEKCNNLCKNAVYYYKKRTHSKLSNTERIVRIFRLEAELQSCVQNNGITFRIGKLIIDPIKRFVFDRKVTLRTLCTYDQYLRTLFMERRPGNLKSV